MRIEDMLYDPHWSLAKYRDARPIPIDTRPEDVDVFPNGEFGVPRNVPCPVCLAGKLTLQPGQIDEDMYICTGGCSMRFSYGMT